MMVRCPCGHELRVRDELQGETIRCMYCGRTLRVRDPVDVEARGGTDDPTPDPGDLFEGVALELDTLQPDAPPAPDPPRPRRTLPAVSRASPLEQVGFQPTQSWWGYLGDAWGYPFRGTAKWTLLMWLCLNVFVLPFVSVIPYVGLFLAAMLFGLLVLYESELIRQSSLAADEEPSLPRWEDVYESAVRPIGHLLTALAASTVPMLLVWVVGWLADMPAWWSHAHTVTLVLAGLLLPINLLAVATADSALAIDPRYTLPAILRAPLPYLVCTLFCGLCLYAATDFAEVVNDAVGGFFLGPLIGTAIWLYLLTVAARALGTLHYAYSDKFLWLR